jgi:hypothetical protein
MIEAVSGNTNITHGENNSTNAYCRKVTDQRNNTESAEHLEITD